MLYFNLGVAIIGSGIRHGIRADGCKDSFLAWKTEREDLYEAIIWLHQDWSREQGVSSLEVTVWAETITSSVVSKV